MGDWESEVFPLDPHHGWKAKPGYKIFVADRGAIRFDIPQDWIFVPGDQSFKFHDRQPPDDNFTLELSLISHPKIDWRGLPLPQLIRQVFPDGKEEEVHLVPREDIEMVWMEMAFTDPHQHRPAHTRVCLARCPELHALFTFNFWLDDLPTLDPAWQELLRTLELGIIVKDPLRGPVRM
jgi:hypothetical protein